ncbi:diaminopimelate decarboxylase [Streptomyces sp. MS19]|uniref:diaminopimelate decarboxylase n=1 Tax=Streptomyces sp. MS19 TaxID=3385972 RepID=UPI0039A016D0
MTTQISPQQTRSQLPPAAPRVPAQATPHGPRRVPDLAVWPRSAQFAADGGDMLVGGVRLAELAERHGTPTYVLDETEIRHRCRAYRAAFPDTDLYYAAQAFLCRALVHWIEEEGFGLDVRSAGETELAVVAGFPPERMVLHGNAKSPEDLRAALRLGVGRIVIGSTQEILRLAARIPRGSRQKVLLRVAPGIAAGADERVRTATPDQQFGLALPDGSAQHAIGRVLAQPRLELVGLHCHLGSQITSPRPYLSAVRRLVGLLARVRDRYGAVLPELNLGGGHGVAYRPGDEELDIRALAPRLRAELMESCAANGLPAPRLAVAPGRAVAGPAGVALHRVLAVGHGVADRTYVAVDGGMSGNPRPALHGERYAPRLIGRRPEAGPRPVTVVGRHGEAGDVLARDVPLPGDVRPGDLLALPVAGAYHLSAASACDSAYDTAGRPPVVGVGEGRSRLLVRRESPDDLARRDLG